MIDGFWEDIVTGSMGGKYSFMPLEELADPGVIVGMP
jgi:hypothetical protein